MTAADRLLPRLDAVRQRGAGQWTARCPAHEDRSPSLSITEKEDRLLVCCHAGCGAADVMSAVGLTAADLFDRDHDHIRPGRPIKRRPSHEKLLRLVRHEALVIALAAGDLARGEKLSDADQATIERALANLHIIGGDT